ncbi:MAG: hypothetical protein ACTIH2_01855 [Anaerococcus sp.]
MLAKKELADSYKNISCLAGHIFQEIYPPCKDCNDDMDSLVLTGLGQNGKEVKLIIKEEGVFEVYGSEDTLKEIGKIRSCRCLYGGK